MLLSFDKNLLLFYTSLIRIEINVKTTNQSLNVYLEFGYLWTLSLTFAEYVASWPAFYCYFYHGSFSFRGWLYGYQYCRFSGLFSVFVTRFLAITSFEEPYLTRDVTVVHLIYTNSDLTQVDDSLFFFSVKGYRWCGHSDTMISCFCLGYGYVFATSWSFLVFSEELFHRWRC